MKTRTFIIAMAIFAVSAGSAQADCVSEDLRIFMGGKMKTSNGETSNRWEKIYNALVYDKNSFSYEKAQNIFDRRTKKGWATDH